MRARSAKYKRIGEKLIQDLEEFDQIRSSGVKIAYLASDEEKTKNRKIVFGDCTKIDSKYRWAIPYDFMITVYEPNCIQFDREQFITLIRHELHHIGINDEGNETAFYIVPHDVEEFWEIINECGLDWSIMEE